MREDPTRPHVLSLCKIVQATALPAIDEELARFVAQMGFGGYCVAVIPEGPVISDIVVTMCGGNLTALVDVYTANGLVTHDPVIRAAGRFAGPVRWSQQLVDSNGIGVPRLRAMLEGAAIADGVTIPAMAVLGRSRALFSVSAVAGADAAAFDDAVGQAGPLLQLAALVLGRSPIAMRTAKAELSNSEILVLNALAEGMRPREIASTLGKSEHTIRNQIVSAQQRLGARTKEQALAMAIRLGLISV